MGSMGIKCFQPWFLLMALGSLSRTGGHVLLNYPASPAYAQAQGFVPLGPSPTTYSTHTIGVPVLSSQSSFFLKSVPRLVTPAVVTPAVPVTPTVVASAVPVTPAVVTPAVASAVPLPSPPSRAAATPAYIVYSDGEVVPLTDSHYKLPPVIEGVVNRVQNYFSNYVQVDPHLLPFPVQNQQNAKIQKLTGIDNSSSAGTTTSTSTKTSTNAINLRLVALPAGQIPLGTNIAFTRTSTVPTSTGRTAKLIEVFRPSGNGFSGSIVRPAEDVDQNQYAGSTNTDSNGEGNNAPTMNNRPSEFAPEGTGSVNNQIPLGGNYPPKGDRPETPDSRPPVPPNIPNRPRPVRPGQGRPEPLPPKGYRYDRPSRPLEYDVPPKREAYRFSGPF